MALQLTPAPYVGNWFPYDPNHPWPGIVGRPGSFFATLRSYHRLSEHTLAMYDGQLQELDRLALASRQQGREQITMIEPMTRKLEIVARKASAVRVYCKLMTDWYRIYVHVVDASFRLQKAAWPLIDVYIEEHTNTDDSLLPPLPKYPARWSIPFDLYSVYDDGEGLPSHVWCPVSGAYLHDSDLATVAFLNGQQIDNRATHALFSDWVYDWGGTLNHRNCLRMSRTYADLLNEDRAAILPTMDLDDGGVSQGFYFFVFDEELRHDNAPDVYYNLHLRRLEFKTEHCPGRGFTLLRFIATALRQRRMSWPTPWGEFNLLFSRAMRAFETYIASIQRPIEHTRKSKQIMVNFCQIFGCMSKADALGLFHYGSLPTLSVAEEDECKAIALQLACAFNHIYKADDEKVQSDVLKGVYEENDDETNNLGMELELEIGSGGGNYVGRGIGDKPV